MQLSGWIAAPDRALDPERWGHQPIDVARGDTPTLGGAAAVRDEPLPFAG